VLHYAIEELGHTQSELAEFLGSRCGPLSRRRALSVDMIRRIGGVENSGRPPRSSPQEIGGSVPYNLWVSVLTGIGDSMYPVVVIFESAQRGGNGRIKIMRNEVMQKIGDRIVSDDGLNEGSVVQIYDEDAFGRTVTFIVVRWDEDPELV
jgi:hypothetical protein